MKTPVDSKDKADAEAETKEEKETMVQGLEDTNT